jgi:hypothetical protein
MNNALNQTCAAPRAVARGPLVRLARRGAAACVMACLAFTVQAQQYGDRGRPDDPRAQRAERYQQQPRQERGESLRGDTRQFEREAYEAREEQRRQQQAQQEQNIRNSEAVRSGGRMTPDERRDLRRQINEAGMDLYPNSRKR